jgi:bifunctional non-homologous end joining protein LigD
MLRNLRTLHHGEPACQKRSDGDHLRFVIYQKDNEVQQFDFTIELNGIKSWAVPDVPSMDPLTYCHAEEDRAESERISHADLLENRDVVPCTWDKGNYIPIDDDGNVLSERQAIQCLEEGLLKFFLQGSKLVGEFILLRKEKKWLLIKRHDEFALYNTYSLESAL